jgi:hypothetical protein
MTLGCGGFGGNITSDNITPRHLLNIKRLAYETTAVPNRFERAAGSAPKRPSVPARAVEPTGIRADVLNDRIARFLSSRGYQGGAPPSAAPHPAPSASQAPGGAGSVTATPSEPPLDFVCEDDVRAAIRAGRKLVVSERAIITPSARELGESQRVFTVAPFRG